MHTYVTKYTSTEIFLSLLTNTVKEAGYSQLSGLFNSHNDLKCCIVAQVVFFYNINGLVPIVIRLAGP